MQPGRCFGLLRLNLALCLAASEARGVGVGPGAFFRSGLLLAIPVQVDRRLGHFGPTMFSGRTTSLKRSSVTKPSLTASSMSVVPFLWAVLATVVALS